MPSLFHGPLSAGSISFVPPALPQVKSLVHMERHLVKIEFFLLVLLLRRKVVLHRKRLHTSFPV